MALIKEGQSIADYLLQIMPDLQLRLKSQSMVDPLAARTLFSIWRDEKNRVGNNLYKRPTTVASSHVEAIEKAGLAKVVGNNLEITEKGAGVIKVMVLGDNSSIYDKTDDRILDYAQALKNTKNASVRRGKGLSKKASADWWNRYE